MNEPLRHKGYTFFQASFIDDSEIEKTVLATVKNYGRLFPYISSSSLLLLVFCRVLLLLILINNIDNKTGHHHPKN